MSDRPNIVVVGGGGAGNSIANGLSAKLDRTKYNLIHVTARPFYVHLPATIRTLVTSEGNLEDRVLMPLEQNLVNGNGSIVTGRVVSIKDEGETGGFITLENGETIKYSYLVLASGSIWQGPLAFPDTKAEVLEHINNWRRQFEKAKNIVLVGGGAVGIELSGELKEFYPDKKVTIVHGNELLLNDTYPVSWRKDVERRIRKRGVQLVLGDYLDDVVTGEDNKVTTRNGQTLAADLIVPCRGGKVNTEFISTLGGEGVIWPASKCVRISPTFQLLHHKRIFAAGDIIEWNEQKQIGKVYTHAAIIVKNIVELLEKRQPTGVYKGSPELICITMGKSHGATYFSWLWGLQFGDRFSTMLKSKDLLINPTRARLGLKP